MQFKERTGKIENILKFLYKKISYKNTDLLVLSR